MTLSSLKWQSLGLTFPISDHSSGEWMREFAQAPATLRIGNRIRIFFATRTQRDLHGNYISRIGWADVSAHDPVKILGVSSQPVMPTGNKGEFDEFGTYPFSAVPFEDGYLGAYAGWTRLVSVPFDTNIGFSFSSDGESFERIGSGPIIAATPDEPFILSGPKLRLFEDSFFLFYIAGRKWIRCESGLEPVYRIRMAHSTDGLHWTRLNRDLIETALGPDEAQASPDVFRRGDSYYMIYSYRSGCDYRSGPGGYRLGLACSKNLLDWDRIDDRLGFTASGEPWDSQMQSYAHWFETESNDVYLAYLGNHVGRDGFGLAKLIHWPENF